ncbi:MAG: hypothetical protein WKF88_07375 [Ferruginibacter sp.]
MGFFKSIMSVISTDGKTGTPFKPDEDHTVYFKGDGVTKTDAARVAGFFKGYGYFTDSNQADVQISSKTATDAVDVGFVIGSPTVSAEVEDYFKDATEGLQELFPGRPVSVYLLDINLKQLKQL